MATTEKQRFSDEEIEEILDMQASDDPIRAVREAIRQDPVLVAGLAFAFGVLIGVSLRAGRKSD